MGNCCGLCNQTKNNSALKLNDPNTPLNDNLMKTCNQNPYRLIALEEAVTKYNKYTHSSHILLWTNDNSSGQEVIYGLMQMRSDGRLGFPGGKSDEETVDQNEIVTALYRELQEEIDFKPVKCHITLEDRVFTHLTITNRVKHFFAKELPLNAFQEVERTHMFARDFPKESLGLIRIPLKATTLSTYKPVRMFFNNYGHNEFAGISRYQLIESVIKLNLIGDSDLKFFEKNMKIWKTD